MQQKEQRLSHPKRRKSIGQSQQSNVLLTNTSLHPQQKRKNPLRSSQFNQLLNNPPPQKDTYFQRQTSSANVLLRDQKQGKNVLLAREQRGSNSATMRSNPGQESRLSSTKRAHSRGGVTQKQQKLSQSRPSANDLRRSSLSRAVSRQKQFMVKDNARQQQAGRRSSSNQRMRNSTRSDSTKKNQTPSNSQTTNSAAENSGSHYLNYLKTYVPTTQPPSVSTSTQLKHKRQPSFSIEEKANEIIRTTDERILLENGIEISPIKKKNHFAGASNIRKRSSTPSKNNFGSDADQQSRTQSLYRKSSQHFDTQRQSQRNAQNVISVDDPRGKNFDSKFSQLEAVEQQLEDEINALDVQLANKSSFVSSSINLKKKPMQRPRSAFVLSSHRKKSTHETYMNEIEETNQNYRHIPLDIDLQIEKHRQRLKNAGIRRRHSAVMRSRSVDRSRNRSVNRSGMSARLLELSKPKIRKAEWDHSTDDTTIVQGKRHKSRERRSQSVPRLRPHSTTKLFGSPKYYEKSSNKSHHNHNIPTIDIEAKEAKHKKTPQVSVHLKHLLIGAAEIERVQSDIRSYEEQIRHQHGVPTESAEDGGRPSLSVRYSASQRNQSPPYSQSSRYEVGGATSLSEQTGYAQRPLSAPARQAEDAGEPVMNQQKHRLSLGANDTDSTARRHSDSGVMRQQQQEASKSSFQQLVEEKLKVLQQTMKNLSRTESKYHKSVDKMTNNLNNSLRQSISSTGSYDFSRAREPNLFSASMDNRESVSIPARFSMGSKQREGVQAQHQQRDASSSGSDDSDESGSDSSDYSETVIIHKDAQPNQQQGGRPLSARPVDEPDRNRNPAPENPLLRYQQQNDDRYNPLLSPNQDDFELAPPFDEQPRTIQRNTPLFDQQPQSVTPPRYLSSKSHKDEREQSKSSAFSVASLMLNREREMKQQEQYATPLDESFNTRFKRLKSKIPRD